MHGLSVDEATASFQTEHLNSPVLSEMMVKGEGAPDASGIENGERNRVAQGPVFVGVPSEDLLGSLLFRREDRHDGQAAGEEPLPGNRPPELPHEQRVGLGFDVVRNEARALLGGDAAGHRDGA